MASWSSFPRPDYNTRFETVRPLHSNRNNDHHVLPSISLAIPKTASFQAPKNGLPINPSPHPSTDPAIQAPIIGRSSPAPLEHHRSPIVAQREYLSPQDISPQAFGDFTQGQARALESYSLSRSSSQTSFDGCQHCQCCRRRKGHTRSNSHSSIASSMTSSSANNVSFGSPNVSSPITAQTVEQKRSSAFGRTFKFLQRSSSLDAHGLREGAARKGRKRSTSIVSKKKQPTKRVVFEMVTEDDHWADE